MPEPNEVFASDEILWLDNGRWGRAGYAIPNPSGKTTTSNTVIFALHSLIGRMMFELAHRDDVKFAGPPHKQFWYDLHQLIVVGRKRLVDETVAPNDSNRLETVHANPVPREWIVYPVPYFEERVRQPDIRRFIELALLLQSEIMQHSDNERVGYVTPSFTSLAGKYLQEILAKMAMRYFGKARVLPGATGTAAATDPYSPTFALLDADFASYDPAKFAVSVEMTEERPPVQWWPTENDLSEIRGMPISIALTFAKRWPATQWAYEGGGNVIADPSTAAPPASSQSNAAAFLRTPGQAP